MTMNLPNIVSNQLFPASPQQSPPQDTTLPSSSGKEDAKLKVLVQPNDVQVKRVGRASCIEPDIKLCVEMDTNVPKTIAVNAYLKVLGKDNKHKLILLRKSDDITFTKTHKREIVGMKLRFLKTIKVQVLKRNLGVSRPEASIVFEAVSKHNEESEGQASTTNFAIISDPRYLDEVKHRRASERNDPYPYPSSSSSPSFSSSSLSSAPSPQQFSDDEYHPVRRVKRRRLDKPVHVTRASSDDSDGSASEYHPPSYSYPHFHNPHAITLPRIEALDHQYPPQYEDMMVLSSGPSSPSTPTSTSSIASPMTPMTPPPSSALLALKECADYELFTDKKEEQIRLAKLVEALKHKGCNFHILPPRSRFSPDEPLRIR